MTRVFRLVLLVLLLFPGALWGQENGPSLAVGGGFSVLLDDHEDFEIKKIGCEDEVKKIGCEDYLFVKNDSRFRPVALTGVLVPINGRVFAAVNFGFVKGGRLVDEVFLGGGVKVGDYAILAAGYSRRFGKELSPGFLEMTKNRLCCRTKSAAYDNYRIKDSGFKGDPIVDSVNGSVSFGLMVPMRVWPAENGQ